MEKLKRQITNTQAQCKVCASERESKINQYQMKHNQMREKNIKNMTERTNQEVNYYYLNHSNSSNDNNSLPEKKKGQHELNKENTMCSHSNLTSRLAQGKLHLITVIQTNNRKLFRKLLTNLQSALKKTYISTKRITSKFKQTPKYNNPHIPITNSQLKPHTQDSKPTSQVNQNQQLTKRVSKKHKFTSNPPKNQPKNS